MTMILFQLNFYTDTVGLTAGAAAAILFWPRIWDAIFDPIMGSLADRTNTRWGKFRPWILWTAVPWAVVMVLAYTTPKGWSMAWLIAYAGITNTLMMTIYSMNNMPYAALGGVMTGDLDERTKLNSYRFIAVNIAQFIVGGFTLPLVAKFAVGHDKAYGWRMTMTTLGRALSDSVPRDFFHHPRTDQARRSNQVFAETGLCQSAEEQPVGGDGGDDTDTLRDHVLPRRGALQLLPSLCRQGRDV